ncbi:thiol reductase thioredoxin [Bacillus sp. FJAT-27225]|uniref:thioredoxin family protein n=1 Tax=Bacillus sp. FJAT-27225 TaxID=1743144 RepID=UPI00080C2FBE|nr:thioredoxin family protein [Bacillus sp. FJAT-27225]OCA84421.1 thiol reductase thioredoxin [Bacillus sp. FJAT-27225]
MKKILIFLGIIIILFAGTAYLTNLSNKETVDAKNPYGKDNLHPETVAQLKDPHYQNIITLNGLNEKLESGEDATVYFYSPTCSYCKESTPILMPLAKDMDITIDQLNVLEYESAWDEFAIEGTPTLIHFEGGKEVARVTGGQDKEQYQQWLADNVKD